MRTMESAVASLEGHQSPSAGCGWPALLLVSSLEVWMHESLKLNVFLTGEMGMLESTS